MRPLLVLALALAGEARAATLVVCKDVCTHTTINSALGVAASGDTISVGEGTWVETLSFSGADLTLIGQGDSGASTTTLQPSSGPEAIYVTDSTLSIDGFDIVAPPGGRGFTVVKTATESVLTLTASTVRDADMSGYGGGLYIQGAATVSFDACTLQDNTLDGSYYGGAIYINESGDTATLQVTNSTFSSNHAEAGGAIYSSGTTVDIDGCEFTGNTVDRDGGGSASGGALAIAWGGAFTIANSTFTSNSAESHAGAISTWSSGLEVSGCEFVGNTVTRFNAGAISLGPSSELITIEDSLFAGSDASWGGAIYHVPTATFSGSPTPEVHIKGCEFFDNTASSGGGAVGVGNGGTVRFEDNTFEGNSAPQGGGIRIQNATEHWLLRNSFCDNTATGEGGAVFVQRYDPPSSADWHGNRFWDNEAGAQGGGAYVFQMPVTMVNNTFVGNGITPGAATFEGGNLFVSDADLVLANSLIAEATLGDGLYVSGSGTWTVESNDWWSNAALHVNGDLLYGDLPTSNFTASPGLSAWSDDSDCSNEELWHTLDSPLVDAGDAAWGDDPSPVGGPPDVGAYGGPHADPDLFADVDGDDCVAMFDCDDGNSVLDPCTGEVCDGLDNDCDGTPDDGLTFSDWWLDSDEDGYGDPAVSAWDCAAPEDHVGNDEDCDDTSSAIYPGTHEVCDEIGVDEDCDELIDDDDPSVTGTTAWHPDGDEDGHGELGSGAAYGCEPPDASSWSDVADDCDDTEPLTYDGADEICDDEDNDCDTEVDEGLPTFTWYEDWDSDGLGDPSSTVEDCSAPAGYVDNSDDCDDTNAAIGEATDWYEDSDEDGFGDPESVATSCTAPAGYVGNSDDCDDTSGVIYPGTHEVCDELDVDEDCDELTEDSDPTVTGKTRWYWDMDDDGHGEEGIYAILYCDPPGSNPWSLVNDDCDDDEEITYPGADEVCDEEDNDCDDDIDEGVQSTFWEDWDSDGLGNPAVSTAACTAPTGWVDNDDDCDDSTADVGDGLEWYEDWDEDSFGDPESVAMACTAPAGYVDNDDDCDDTSGVVYPGTHEVCDELDVDEDCDELTEDDDPSVTGKAGWYWDMDDDGHGEEGVAAIAYCDPPDSNPWSTVADDCDDDDELTYPGADEVCDDEDNDCDDDVDEGLPAPDWYEDWDEDGFGDPGSTVTDCAAPPGWVGNDQDCDDTAATVYPGATEICNEVDDDCDEKTDEDDAADATTWYLDSDEDGYGDPAHPDVACDAPSGYVDDDSDCDPAEGDTYPGADEVCDGRDNDCDDGVDEGLPTFDWYLDDDEDGFGDPAVSASSCGAPEGYVANDDDCDDTTGAITTVTTWYEDWDDDDYGDPAVSVDACEAPTGFVANDDDCDDVRSISYPGADEVCDGRDNDCDGPVDDDPVDASSWYEDHDSDDFGDVEVSVEACNQPDGFVSDATDCDDSDGTSYPGADEVCDETDHDCDEDPINGLELTTWYQDADGDGWGDADLKLDYCAKPDGYVGESGDCDDSAAGTYPGADDAWYDGVDADCQGDSDYDQDGDGYDREEDGGGDCDDLDDATYPGAEEDPGPEDRDCDGHTDPTGELVVKGCSTTPTGAGWLLALSAAGLAVGRRRRPVTA